MSEYSSKKCEAPPTRSGIKDSNQWRKRVVWNQSARSVGLIRYSHIFVTKYHAENYEKKIMLSKSKSKIKILRFWNWVTWISFWNDVSILRNIILINYHCITQKPDSNGNMENFSRFSRIQQKKNDQFSFEILVNFLKGNSEGQIRMWEWRSRGRDLND